MRILWLCTFLTLRCANLFCADAKDRRDELQDFELTDDSLEEYLGSDLESVKSILTIAEDTPGPLSSVGFKILCKLLDINRREKCHFTAEEHAFFVSENRLKNILSGGGEISMDMTSVIRALDLPTDDKGNLYLAPLPQTFFQRLLTTKIAKPIKPKLIETSHLSPEDLRRYIEVSLESGIPPLIFLADRSRQIKHAFVMGFDPIFEQLLIFSDLDGKKFSLTTSSVNDIFDIMSIELVKRRLKTLQGTIQLVYSSSIHMGNAVRQAMGIITPETELEKMGNYNLIIFEKLAQEN